VTTDPIERGPGVWVEISRAEMVAELESYVNAGVLERVLPPAGDEEWTVVVRGQRVHLADDAHMGAFLAGLSVALRWAEDQMRSPRGAA